MKRSRLPRISAFMVAVGLLAGSGCDLFLTGSEGEGTLRVLITDNPFPYELASAANATIARVDLVAGGQGVITLSDSSRSFNLLTLQDGVTALLAEEQVPEGTYYQMRLIVTEASVVLNDGTTFDLFVPSGAQTGIKILLPSGLEVAEGQ
jgi:hypothetical protein